MSSEYSRTPGGMLAAIDDFSVRLRQLESHFGAVVTHLADGGKTADVPTEAPAAPAPVATTQQVDVLEGMSGLTAEQKKKALQILLSE